MFGTLNFPKRTAYDISPWISSAPSTDWQGETLSVGEISPGDTNYSIQDSAAALLAADPAILEAAAEVGIVNWYAGTLRVDEQLALAALTTVSGWTYEIEDSAAALLGADMAVLLDANYVTLIGGDAGSLLINDQAILSTLTSDLNWTYSLTDTAANLVDVEANEPIISATSVSVSAGAAAAADLNGIDNNILQILDASAVTEITGTAAEIAVALSADSIDTASDVAVTIDAGAALASDLNTIAVNTMAVVDADGITEITGTAAEIASVIDSASMDIAPDVAVTIDAGPAAAADLISINSNTSKAVNANMVTLISGTAAEIASAISAGGIDTALDVAVTASAGTATASDLNTIGGNTSAVVNARAISALTGTAEQIAAMISSDGIDTAADVAVKPDAGTAAAAELNTIDSHTTAAVDARLITGRAGTVTEILKFVAAQGITTAANYDVSATGSIDAAELAVIDAANGSGTLRTDSNTPESAYLILTPTTPTLTIANGIFANVIDSPGVQVIHVAAGGKLNLSGSDGHNLIVFDDYAPTDLSVSHAGTTAIFSLNADSTQIAWIATDSAYAPTQTMAFSDGSQTELTLVGSSLQFGGVAITDVGEFV
ncbi:MAG: hypothetical protein NTY41_17555 [Proteobacteria bacterium]|nr:hypothetical protein [Pseudomonadota bacterium]